MPAIGSNERKDNGYEAGECGEHHGELVHETHRLDTFSAAQAARGCRGMRHAPKNR